MKKAKELHEILQKIASSDFIDPLDMAIYKKKYPEIYKLSQETSHYYKKKGVNNNG